MTTEQKLSQHYKSRLKDGKEQVYTDPDVLQEKAFAYFAWCEDNPLLKKELSRSGENKGQTVEVPIVRPFTLVGMCVYCGISEKTFAKYKSDKVMGDIAEHLSDIIQQHHLEGAISGTYNSSFISRLLESAEKEEPTDNTNLPFIVNVINKEAKEELEKLRDRGRNSQTV